VSVDVHMPRLSRRTFLAGAAGSFWSASRLAAAAPAADLRIPILCYHRFDPSRSGSTTITLAAVEEQLRLLDRHGYQIVTLAEAIALLRAGTTDAAKRAVITVDDGHGSVYRLLYPLIRRRNVPVTLFVYTGAISYEGQAMTWSQLREMRDSGLVAIESHTASHPRFGIEREARTDSDYQAFVAAELERPRQILRRQVASAADYLAWPYGVVDPELEAAAQRAGYVAALGYGGGPATVGMDLYNLPRIGMDEQDKGDRFLRRIGERSDRSESMTSRPPQDPDGIEWAAYGGGFGLRLRLGHRRVKGQSAP